MQSGWLGQTLCGNKAVLGYCLVKERSILGPAFEALTSACHSLKQLFMAFLLLQLPTFTVGMIFSGRSHCTKRFSSK